MKLKETKDGILVPVANKAGYILCKWGGCFDPTYPSSTTRRGRVIEAGQIANALTVEGVLYVVERR